MSYPGHLRSLHLSERHVPNSDHVDDDDGQRHELTHKRKHTGSSSNGRDAGSLDSNSVYFSPGEIPDTVYDDRGNEARPSLWIGNVGKGVSEYEVKAIFGLGNPEQKIQSMRIQPNGRENYIFVNYWEVEDATQALTKYHQRDIFERGRPIYIRFARSQEEAVREKIATSRTATKPEVKRKEGLPPTGPRAMRRSISPPPLKRPGKSRRSTDRSMREGSTRSLKRRRTREKLMFENCYRPTYRDDESHEQRLLRQSSRRSSDAEDEYGSFQDDKHVPAGWMQNQHDRLLEETSESARPSESLGSKQRLGGTHGDYDRHNDNESFLQSVSVDHQQIDLDGMPISSENTMNSTGFDLDGKQLSAEYTVHQSSSHRGNSNAEEDRIAPTTGQSFDHLVRLFETQGRLERSEAEDQTLKSLTNLNAVSTEGNASITLLNTPLDRVRNTTEETDITMSSNKSAIRRKTCAKCDKSETALSALSLKCLHCPRKFHSACGNASGVMTEEATFVCSRCIRKGKVGPGSSESVAPSARLEETFTPTNCAQNKEDNSGPGKPVLDHDNLVATLRSASGVFLQMHRIDTSCSASQTANNDDFKPDSILNASHLTNDDHRDPENHVAPNMYAVTKTAVSKKVYEDARSMIERYKSVVTCAHWEKNNCRKINEQDCMFAHTHTDIGSPRSARSIRDWTCYHWRSQGTCYDQICAHAHYDTGLYVGYDGWASKKHLTCPFYYNRGRCRKSEIECPYAHQDTGFLAPEPQGSTKIAVEHADSLANDTFTKTLTMNPQPLRIDTASLTGQIYTASMSNGPYSPSSALQSDSSYSPVDAMQVLATSETLELDKTIIEADVRPGKMTNQAAASQASSTVEDKAGPPTELRNDELDQMSRDPRKSKPTPIDPEVNVTRNEAAGNQILPSQTEHADDRPARRPTQSVMRQFSMRECKLCGKKVLKNDICVTCKDSRSLTGQTSPTKSLGPSMTGIISRNSTLHEEKYGAQEHTDTHLDSLISGEFGRPTPKDTASVRVLKRAASGSNMFLPNKRARPSLTTTQSGPVTEVRLDGTKLITDQPTIEALIERAKECKAVENTFGLEADEAIEIESPGGATELSAVANPVSEDTHADVSNPLGQSPVCPSPQNSELKENSIIKFFSPRQLPKEQSQIQDNQEQAETGGLYSQSICSTPLMDGDDELQKWIGKPHSLSVTVPQSRSRSASQSSSGDSDVPLAMLETRKVRKLPDEAPLRNEVERVPTTPAKKPCHCAGRRRKCLHSDQPPFDWDSQKCYEWLLAETARGSEFKGRSKSELVQIQNAARGYAANTSSSADDGFDDDISVEEETWTSPKKTMLTGHDAPKSEKTVEGPSTNGSVESVEELFDESIAPTDEETAATSHSSPPPAGNQAKIKDDPLVERLRQRGVEFESSEDECGEEEIPDFFSNRVERRDLQLQLPAITKGQGLKNRRLLFERQMIRNQLLHGNSHFEIDQSDQKHVIRAKVQHKVRHQNIDRDRFLPDSLVIEDDDITLQEFLGIPQHITIEPCLFAQGATETLAFREKERDHDYSIFDFAGIRNKRRVNDVQKWPLTER